MAQEEQLLQRINQLSKMSTIELRAKWLELFGTAAPPFNKKFLQARIAYRLQEVAYGGLSEKVSEKLKKLQNDSNERKSRPATVKPPAGTVLVREFKGIEHRVCVLQDGFDYQGVKFRSLSAIAKKIAGCNWNGLKFFGLRSG